MERNMDARLRQFESRVGNLERSMQGMEQIRSVAGMELTLHAGTAARQSGRIQTTVNEKLAQS